MTSRRDMRVPPASDFEAFQADPLGQLAIARASLGEIFVVRESGPVFSGGADCSATVAVFGAAQLQQVLSDNELFAMPASSSPAKEWAMKRNPHQVMRRRII